MLVHFEIQLPSIYVFGRRTFQISTSRRSTFNKKPAKGQITATETSQGIPIQVFRSADFNASSLTPITAPNIRFEKLPEMEHKPIEDEGRYGAVCTVTLNNDDTDR